MDVRNTFSVAGGAGVGNVDRGVGGGGVVAEELEGDERGGGGGDRHHRPHHHLHQVDVLLVL